MKALTKEESSIRNKESHKRYRERSKEVCRARSKKYYTENKEKNKEYRRNSKERIKKRQHIYYMENKETLRNSNKKYREEHREELKIKQKKYNDEHREEANARGRKVYQRRKNKYNIWARRYRRVRWRINEEYNIKIRLRSRVLSMFRKFIKVGKIAKARDYGINYQAILEHLRPFPENIEDYHIHHIQPLFTFCFINEDSSTNEDEIRKALAPENHVWMTIKEHKNLNHAELAKKYIKD